MKRSSKFYSKYEKQLAKELGLKAVLGSGAGWIDKEDMESETLLVQLKSTDKMSYSLKLKDIKELEYHAATAHKTPVFLIQFLQEDRLYGLVDLDLLAPLLPENSTATTPVTPIEFSTIQSAADLTDKKIKSTTKARNQFYQEKEKEHGKESSRRKK